MPWPRMCCSRTRPCKNGGFCVHDWITDKIQHVLVDYEHDLLVLFRGYQGIHHHHHHHGRVAGEGRRVVAPPCPRSTARLQSSPVGRVESSRSWSSHLLRGRPGGRRHVRSRARPSDTFTWSRRAAFTRAYRISPFAAAPTTPMITTAHWK